MISDIPPQPMPDDERRLLSGAFAITPPGFEGVLPEGVAEIKAPTTVVLAYIRTMLRGPHDLDAARVVHAGYTLGPAIIQMERQIQATDPMLIAARSVMVEFIQHVVDGSTAILCRLFHDRVMRMDTVVLEQGATMGPHCVALPAARLGAGATVGPASLVMRGDEVPPSTRWQGNPIAPWNVFRKKRGDAPEPPPKKTEASAA